jgi:UDP-N-acetylmuramoylalanine--D-glutamate ligase
LEASPPPATLVKSPGVPQDAPVVVRARAGGLEVMGELELGWRLVPNEFIAVTGTNGKTTTAELIGAMHRAAGVPVAVAGNVGTPVSSLAGAVDPAATIVCEASSFQLEDSIAFAPEAAVFLNFSADHLDRHDSLDDYRAAKLRIFANQTADDLAVVGEGLGLPELAARTVHFGEGDLLEPDDVRLRGPHNLANATAAATVCLERGLDAQAVRAALRDFPGIEHRMEHVADIGGVEYVNDSKATNVVAAAAALRSFPGGVHVILGGSLKGGDFTELAPVVAGHCRGVYLIGEAAAQLAEDLADTGVELVRCGDLERAEIEASKRAQPGEVVLLAPACASFDQYRDYEERGAHFKELVHRLEGTR